MLFRTNHYLGLRLCSLLISIGLSHTVGAATGDVGRMRVMQGQFKSTSDQEAFQNSISKALGGKVRIDNPADHPVNGDGEGGDQLGYAVALSGNTAVVGARLDQHSVAPNAGSAYVFVRAGGNWALEAKLTAPDAAQFDEFGSTVALSGDTALIGAPKTQQGGAAYVFVRIGQTWSNQAKLAAQDTGWGDVFGSSVSLSGDVAVIGAPGKSNSAGGSAGGAAYVFTRNGTAWSESSPLTVNDSTNFAHFGFSVAVSGNTAVVGAPYGASPGSAYVFTFSGSAWSEQTKLAAADGELGDNFGYSVAVSGDTALVGARLDNTALLPDVGSVSVFVRSGTEWAAQAKLVPADGDVGDEFGYAVALYGQTAMVGARWHGGPFNDHAGAVYAYIRSGTAWSSQGKLLSNGVDSGDEFGSSVALSGDTVLFGAPRDDTVAGSSAGSAAVFFRNGSTWNQQTLLTAGNGAAAERFGYSVALDGNTALIGVPNTDSPTARRAGAAYVFVRTIGTWTLQAKLMASDAEEFAGFGLVVALFGDTALIGSPLKDGSLPNYFRPDVGAAYVFVRNGTSWAEQAKLIADDNETGDEFGNAVSLRGDTALIAAHRDDIMHAAAEGSAYVFLREGSDWEQQAKLVASDAANGAEFGWSAAVSDNSALISARNGGSEANPGVGSAYVFTRSGAVWTEQAELLAADSQVHDQFGRAVAISGDTAFVGSPSSRNPFADASGAAYIFTRSGTSWSLPTRLTADAPVSGAYFGYSVCLAGDTALIGAPTIGFGPAPGVVYQFVRQGLAWNQDIKTTGDGTPDGFGVSVSISGDTVIVGAPLYSASESGNPDIGAVFLLMQVLFADSFDE